MLGRGFRIGRVFLIFGALVAMLLRNASNASDASSSQNISSSSLGEGQPASGIRYRAAVVELYPLFAWSAGRWNGTAAGAVSVMLENVGQVDEWAAKASSQGAQIVVFPEELISSFGYAAPQLFSITLPEENVPLCDASSQADLEAVDPVVRALGCVAQRHNIVIVVGVSIIGACTPRLEPFTGHPMPCNHASRVGHYDGAAAFGPDGSLLGSHKRQHLGYTWASSDRAAAYMEAEGGHVTGERGYFDTPFGVRFGFLVDSDVNFADPLLSLVQRGVGDFVYSACPLNVPYRDYGGSLRHAYSRTPRLGGLAALAFQSALSIGAGVNLLAANGHYGSVTTGSGVWPADPFADFAQHSESFHPWHGMQHYQGSGWLGVQDVVSIPAPPRPRYVKPIAGPELLAIGEHGTFSAVWFNISTYGAGVRSAGGRGGAQAGTVVRAEANGVSCILTLSPSTMPASRGRGMAGRHNHSYALVVAGGLSPFGYHVEVCTVSACARDAPALDCLYPPSSVTEPPPGFPRAGGNAPDGFVGVRSLHLTLSSERHDNNLFLPSVLCSGGSVPLPRPRVAQRGGKAATRVHGVNGTDSGREGRLQAVRTCTMEWWEGGRDGADSTDATEAAATPGMSGRESSCGLLSATLEARARSHKDGPLCPRGLDLCPGYAVDPDYLPPFLPGAGPSGPSSGSIQAKSEAFVVLAVLFAFLAWHTSTAESASALSAWTSAERRRRRSQSVGEQLPNTRGGRMAAAAAAARRAATPAIDLVKWAANWSDVIEAQHECPVCLEPFDGKSVEMQACQLHKVCTTCAAQWRVATTAQARARMHSPRGQLAADPVPTCPVCRGTTPDARLAGGGKKAEPSASSLGEAEPAAGSADVSA